MPKILIVEDIKMNALMIAAALEDIGADIVFAVNGLEAIEMFERYDIDLILMDLHMPKMNGFEAVTRIHETAHYQARPIPIIAVTANALMEEKKQFLKSTGLTDYLTKPVRRDVLLTTVRKHLPKPEIRTTIKLD